MLIKRTQALLCATLLLSSPLPGQGHESPTNITPESFEAHVLFLADDLLEGRNDGTRGYDIAANYVRSQFLSSGLKPGNGSQWFQSVPLVRRGSPTDVSPSVMVGGESIDPTGALIYINQEAVNWSGEIVFAGYGVQKPEKGIDELKGLEVKGKLVLYVPYPPDDWEVFDDDVERGLINQGAAGILQLPALDPKRRLDWGTTRFDRAPLVTETSRDGNLQFKGWIGFADAGRLFAGAPASYDEVMTRLTKGEIVRGFSLKPLVHVVGAREWRRSTSSNIIGMIPGRDPSLAKEAILVTAHLDHLGRQGDGPIHNGALDNAAGVATMIEAARVLNNSRPPRRTVIFAAVTAEEDGLLGSKWLADNFPGGLDKIVAVVNLDMPVLTYDFTDIVAYGAEQSELGAPVARAAAKFGVKLSADPMPSEVMFMRSDHFSFVRKGIPGVFVTTGFANNGEAEYKHFLKTDYHKPSDNLDLPIDYRAGARFAALNVVVIREIADMSARPRWYTDSLSGKIYARDKPHVAPPRS